MSRRDITWLTRDKASLEGCGHGMRSHPQKSDPGGDQLPGFEIELLIFYIFSTFFEPFLNIGVIMLNRFMMLG